MHLVFTRKNTSVTSLMTTYGHSMSKWRDSGLEYMAEASRDSGNLIPYYDYSNLLESINNSKISYVNLDKQENKIIKWSG